MDEQSPVEKLSVFVSYSRRDLEFADQLVAILEWQGFHVIIDRKGIHGAEKWEERLAQLILEADTVLFVLSPDSAESDVCKWEVEEAARRAKRLVPVLCRPLEGTNPHELLRDLNYIHFYADNDVPGSGFGTGQVRLIEALKVDVGWLREHTRLEELAARWDKNGRVYDLLVRGYELTGYQSWRDRRPANAPDLTPLQRAFLADSEAQESNRASAERKRLEEMAAVQSERQRALDEAQAALQREAAERAARNRARRIIQWGSGVVAVAVIATALGFAAVQQQNLATQKLLTATAEKEKAEADRARAQQEVLTKTAQKEKAAADEARAHADTARSEATSKTKRLVQFLGEVRRANLQSAEYQFSGSFGPEEQPKAEVAVRALSDSEIYDRMKLPIVGTNSECAESKEKLIRLGRGVLNLVPSAFILDPEQFRALVFSIGSKNLPDPTYARQLDLLIANKKYNSLSSQLRALGWIGRGTDVPIDDLARSEEAIFVIEHASSAAKTPPAATATYYPLADKKILTTSRGEFPDKYPKGAVVHFPAGKSGRDWTDAEATIRYMSYQGHGVHFIISPSGQIYQTLDLTKWGNHAGRSSYPGIGDHVSRFLVGIEVLSAGQVRKGDKGFEPWFNKPSSDSNTYYGRDDVRFVAKFDNIRDSGYYHKYTRAQEVSLTNLLLWLQGQKSDVFSFDFVVGHDEVSPNRKNDPGGALSMTMPQYRGFLKRLHAAGVAAVDGEFFPEWRSDIWTCDGAEGSTLPDLVAARADLNRGVMLLDEGKESDAEAAFLRAGKRGMDSETIAEVFIRARIEIGTALLRKGVDDKAKAEFDRALESDPSKAEEINEAWANAYIKRGRGLLENRADDEANAAFNLALTRFPGKAEAINEAWAEAHIERGRYFLEMSADDEAKTQFHLALARSPSMADDINAALTDSYIKRGSKLLAEGEPAAARAKFEGALSIVTGANRASLHEFLARTWYHEKRLEEALKEIDLAIGFDSKNLEFLSIRGLLQIALGRIQDACGNAAAVDEDLVVPVIDFLRGRCFEWRGDIEKAKVAYRRGLSEVSNDNYSVEVLTRERLQGLGVSP